MYIEGVNTMEHAYSTLTPEEAEAYWLSRVENDDEEPGA